MCKSFACSILFDIIESLYKICIFISNGPEGLVLKKAPSKMDKKGLALKK